MTKFILYSLLFVSVASAAPVPLFDGKTFNGWEGETTKVWRIADGVIMGGTLDGNPLVLSLSCAAASLS